MQNKKKQEPLKVEPLQVLLTGQQDANLGILLNLKKVVYSRFMLVIQRWVVLNRRRGKKRLQALLNCVGKVRRAVMVAVAPPQSLLPSPPPTPQKKPSEAKSKVPDWG